MQIHFINDEVTKFSAVNFYSDINRSSNYSIFVDNC